MRTRVTVLEDALARTGEAIAALQEELSRVPPATEIQRLNYAFELIADRAPASEIERLNHAFELIADRAPASEIERLSHAFEQLSDLARQFEATRKELSDLASRLGRVSQDVTWESERTNRLLEKAEGALPGPMDEHSVESFASHLNSRFDALYHRFENLYRGSRGEITERLGVYRQLLDLPKLREIGPAIDLGAGRGEWIEFLSGLGFEAYGVDVNEEMARAAAELGLAMRVDDILSHLRSLEHNSVGIVSMFHVAEHLEFEVLVNVIRASSLVLDIGGALVIETPNPTNLLVGAASFYLDPTHIKPIHPKLLEFLYAETGFTRVVTHYLNQGGQLPLDVPQALQEDPAGLRLVEFLNENLLGPLDYVVVGYKS
jgi:O-antigen chain-terminating methyltransferase